MVTSCKHTCTLCSTNFTFAAVNMEGSFATATKLPLIFFSCKACSKWTTMSKLQACFLAAANIFLCANGRPLFVTAKLILLLPNCLSFLQLQRKVAPQSASLQLQSQICIGKLGLCSDRWLWLSNISGSNSQWQQCTALNLDQARIETKTYAVWDSSQWKPGWELWDFCWCGRQKSWVVKGLMYLFSANFCKTRKLAFFVWGWRCDE